jgi:hypothetical protein
MNIVLRCLNQHPARLLLATVVVALAGSVTLTAVAAPSPAGLGDGGPVMMERDGAKADRPDVPAR